jgi:hypothetical protein
MLFLMAVWAFLTFLVRRNPQHITDIKLAYSFPLLVFGMAYTASRFTGKFVIVVLSWIIWILLGVIAFFFYSNAFSFKANSPASELAIAVVFFLAMALVGSAVGFSVFRRATRTMTNSANGSNGA